MQSQDIWTMLYHHKTICHTHELSPGCFTEHILVFLLTNINRYRSTGEGCVPGAGMECRQQRKPSQECSFPESLIGCVCRHTLLSYYRVQGGDGGLLWGCSGTCWSLSHRHPSLVTKMNYCSETGVGTTKQKVIGIYFREAVTQDTEHMTIEHLGVALLSLK